uniref:Vomeronasal type-2 receptor 26 n=1 Tax=Angiostrongylus cantonensis TaxID=6313 RepID=A0A0K0DRH7_ANGCA
MLLCLVQGKAVYILTTRGRVLPFFTLLLPCLQILSTSMLMLIVCLQQDQDKQKHVNTLSNFQMQITLFCLRFIDLTVFSTLTPSVCSSYYSYLEFKPCHTHVSISAAVTEYTWMCLIALFYVSQINDYKCFTLNLTVTENDTIPREDLFNYYPAFMTAAFDNAPFANIRPRRQLRWRPPSTPGLPKTSHRCLSRKCLMQ